VGVGGVVSLPPERVVINRTTWNTIS